VSKAITMCPNLVRYRYTPHKLLDEHPRLFVSKCYKMTSYTIDSVPHCLDCYDRITEAVEFTATIKHLLIDGPTLRGTICEVCRKRLFQVQSAISCNECFNAYMYIAMRTRETGNDPRDLKGFLYDVLREQLIRLFIAEDFDL